MCFQSELRVFGVFGSVWCRWLERGNGEVVLGDVADVGGCLVVDPDGRDRQVGRVAVAFSERQGDRVAGPCHRQPWRPPQVPWVSRYFLASYLTGTYCVVPARSGGGGGGGGAKPSALGPRVGWSVPFLLSRRG